MQRDQRPERLQRTHVVGLTLWRGGILLVAAYLGYWALRATLQITDAQLEFSVAVLLVGLLLVFASVVLERIHDARSERKNGS